MRLISDFKAKRSCFGARHHEKQKCNRNRVLMIMNRLFSADYVLPVSGGPIKNGVVKVGPNDEILGVYASPDDPEIDGPIVRCEGIIVPGFVNTHCHLELSHLKGKIPKHTGLISFLEQVMSTRKASEATIRKAMEAADEAMYKNGIVAVGDHANSSISANLKAKSKIHYHTFIEVMGFDAALAEQRLNEAVSVREAFESTSSSLTLHAPYSVSKHLYMMFRAMVGSDGPILSIHNQESEEENRLYRYKSGQFIDFYDRMGVDIGIFKAQSRNSLQTTVPYLPKNSPLILVHNTFTTARDIFFLERMAKQVTWCLCPNANEYIESALPKIRNFIQGDFPIAVGTDSLASNDQLCILSELKALHAAFDGLDLQTTIRWATINGANALGISNRFGSLEKGKQPGLNLISHTNGFGLTAQSQVERLV